MAAPAFDPSAESTRSVPLREARNRLTQLVAFAELTDVVTLITRDGETRPAAAIVPAPAARTVAQTRAEDDRLRAVTAGWARRLDALHERSARMHAAELGAVAEALAEVWAQLDRRVPPGTDPELTRLRAAHGHLLAAVSPSVGQRRAASPTGTQQTAAHQTAAQPPMVSR